MKMSPREKWLAVLVGLLALGYVGVIYVIDPFLASQEAVQEAIEQKRFKFEELMMLVAERERYQHKVDDLRVRVSEAEAILLKEDKVPVAAAEVQEVVHQFGRETGVSIVRESVMRPKEQDLLVEIPVELSLKGSLREVHHFLYKVEMYGRLLTIPQMTIRSSIGSNGALSVDLQIAGHMPRGRTL